MDMYVPTQDQVLEEKQTRDVGRSEATLQSVTGHGCRQEGLVNTTATECVRRYINSVGSNI